MTEFATGLELLGAIGGCLSVALLIYGAYLACVSRVDRFGRGHEEPPPRERASR